MNVYDLAPPLLLLLFAAGLWLALYNLLPVGVRVGRRISRAVASLALRNEPAKRWVGTRGAVIRPYLPAVLILVAGVLVTVLAGDGFLDLAEDLRAKSAAMQRVDRLAYDWAATLRSRPATHFFVFFTMVGTPVVLGGLCLVIAAILALRRRYRWAVYLLFTAGGGAILNLMLKGHFERARPALSAALRQAHGFSFPSGHAMGSTVVFCALTYLSVRAFHSWTVRSLCITVAVTLIVAICMSRIYLGVHWISDIGAGLSAGLLWVTTTTIGYETVRRIRALRARKVSPP